MPIALESTQALLSLARTPEQPDLSRLADPKVSCLLKEPFADRMLPTRWAGRCGLGDAERSRL